MSEQKPINIAPEPVALDFTQKSFKANGKTYHISEKISIDRWAEYEKLMPRLTYGIDFESMNKSHAKAFAALNEKRFADAAVIIHNLMSGIKDANDDTRVHPALLMCALVINFEGEDVGLYDKNIQLQKIEDWKAEGLDILSFFAFALRSINGFRETYLLYIAAQAEKIIEKSELIKKSQ
jgi:hypothetical protein